MLVVCFGTLCFNVLLDGVNLTLIVDQFLLNVIQLVVDIGLCNLIPLGVVLHLLVSDLLIETVSVDIQESFNQSQSLFFLLELDLKIISLREFGRHLFLHLGHLQVSLLNFVVNSLIKMFDFF